MRHPTPFGHKLHGLDKNNMCDALLPENNTMELAASSVGNGAGACARSSPTQGQHRSLGGPIDASIAIFRCILFIVMDESVRPWFITFCYNLHLSTQQRGNFLIGAIIGLSL